MLVPYRLAVYLDKGARPPRQLPALVLGNLMDFGSDSLREKKRRSIRIVAFFNLRMARFHESSNCNDAPCV